MNQDIINEIKDRDYKAITETIEKFLLDQIEKHRVKGIILGLSGGIDSAVLAYICKRKLKEKTLAIIMPDTQITPSIRLRLVLYRLICILILLMKSFSLRLRSLCLV